MQYFRSARVKFIPATGRTGARVRVAVYSPIGELEHRVVRGYNYAKSFHDQVEDILAELQIQVDNPRVAAISGDEEVWILDD